MTKQLMILALLIGCSTTPTVPELGPSDVDFNQEYTVRPGEVVRLRFPHFWPSEKGTLRCRESEVPATVMNGELVAYWSESYFSDKTPFECLYQVEQQKAVVARVQVLDKDFPSERLNVDMRHVVLSPEDQARVQTEQIFLNKNYEASPSKPYFSTPFLIPLDTFITSIYGSRRVFNNQKQTQHLGTDFRAMPGVPIHSSNAGKVVVARELFYTGLTVTVDHGMNIFTVYGHLSEIKAVEGEFVPQGALIGLSGATGRVTGPHLHWGVRVNGHFIDGHSLAEQTQELAL